MTHDLQLTFSNGTITGNAVSRMGMLEGRNAVTGNYADGVCNITVRKAGYVGPCASSRFSGDVLSSGKPFGTFVFLNADEPVSADRQAAASAQRGGGGGGRGRSDIPPSFRMDAPSEGFFDYVQGDDIEPGQSGSSTSGSTPQGLAAPSGTRWAYGRNRWVVPPGGGCGRAELVRGYCFGAVIGYLRSRPKQKDVTAITLSRPAPLGTFISNDTPIRYQFVQVKRDGEWFRGDRDLRGTSKVQTPPGCHFAPLREGFVVTGPGPQGLQEAALFRCP